MTRIHHEIPGGSLAGWDYNPDWNTEIVLATYQLQTDMIALRLFEPEEFPEVVTDLERADLRQWRKIQTQHPRPPVDGGTPVEYAVYAYYREGRFRKSVHAPLDKWVVKKDSIDERIRDQL